VRGKNLRYLPSSSVSAVGSDLQVILRQMRKTPLNLIACLLTLGVGIGGTTAAFSALYTVTLRPLPYPHPGQLVAVHSKFPSLQMDRLGISPLDYLDLRRNTSLSVTPVAFII
jgi:putative ABC transport system permease protein